MVAGFFVLFNSPGSPEFARLSITSAIIISLATAGFFLFLVTKALKAQQNPPVTGLEGLVGQLGLVKSELRETSEDDKDYQGTILVKGELWKAISDEHIARDEQVVVKSVDRFTLRVKKTGP
jgi:membrane-bound serine protease (ClpP class)